MTHTIVRLDKVKSTQVGHIYSLKAGVDLDNGSIGFVGDLVSGERELRDLTQPTTALIPTKRVVLIANPEVIYDQFTMASQDISGYYNVAGTGLRGYELVEDDEFAVTKDGISLLATDPVVGNYVVAQNGSNKLKEATTVTTEKFVGKIEAIETLITPYFVGQAGQVNAGVSFVKIRVIQN